MARKANAFAKAQPHEQEYLARLASLRGPVDRFFDDVMVMADNPAVRGNRLALLGNIGGLFLETADISRLQS